MLSVRVFGASSLCCGPSATGSGSGADWSNIKVFTGTPSLARGNTYYLRDGTYGDLNLSTAISSGTLITIKKAISSDHVTDTGWNLSTMGAGRATNSSINFATSNWFVDGQTGGGPSGWETGFGFFMQMPISNGSQTAGFTTGNSAFDGSTTTNVTVQHMEVDCGWRGRNQSTADEDGEYLVNTVKWWTNRFMFFHDSSRTFILTWPSSNVGETWEYCKFARNGTAEHRELWSFGIDQNVTFRYNLCEDIFGTGILAGVNNTGAASNWDVYGNAFYWTGNFTDGIINTGIFVAAHAPPTFDIQAVNWHIYNNVIANNISQSFTSAIDLEGSPSGCVCENNIWYNNKDSGGSAGGGNTIDYNWYYANTSNGTSGSHDVVGSANPFTSSTPWTSGDWTLKAQIAGLSLSSPYNTDWLGNTGTSRGALQFTSGGTTVINPTAWGSAKGGSFSQ